MVLRDDPKNEERLEKLRHSEEEDLAKLLSERYSIPYIDLSSIPINTDALRLIPEKDARAAGIASFSVVGKKVRVGIISPAKNSSKEIIEKIKRDGYDVSVFIASSDSLEKAWSRYSEVSLAQRTEAGVFDVSNQEIASYVDKVRSIEDLRTVIKDILGDKAKYKISRALEVILAGAIAVKASDIHTETEDEAVRLRFRLDGVLQDIATISFEAYHFLLSRVKLLSGLKLNIRETAQDGRFSIKVLDKEIEVRTSIIPGGYGESVVLRILNPDAIAVTFENLGIEPMLLETIIKQVEKPNGMILTTGPTGSGKTTTLYAFLKRVYTPEVKVITIEDPIEYHIDGITQTQTNRAKGYTFLEGLRSSLRQDPDIIMIGEIRDAETAKVAVNAALTGHLVFSTLHTNNAAGVFPRLIDLEVNPKVISSAVNISLAQRLVRTLCSECKKEAIPTEKEKAVISLVLEGVKRKGRILPEKISVWHPGDNKACPKCGGVGYKGRIGIYEGILIDSKVEEVISTKNASEREIKQAAEGQKMLTMREDGILKVLSGMTSIDELRRVIDLEED